MKGKFRDFFKLGETDTGKQYAVTESEGKEEYSIDRFISQAYTKAWQVTREKRTQLLNRLCLEPEDFVRCTLPYNIPQYIQQVCNLLKELIADVSHIDISALDVDFFCQKTAYSGAKDQSWRCMREERKAEDGELQMFYQLQDCSQTYLYVGDKRRSAAENDYFPNRKDLEFNLDGSAMLMKVNLEQNGRKYRNGMLVISSYGNTFSPVDSYCSSIGKSFKTVLADTLLSYYRMILQTELGLMYEQELYLERR
ncbi:MAG: hypothetical protein PHE06_02245 [Lachnospiraceae bacterium]|nr:hypothetical protein [Lachnospiraceae bacterium]